MTRCRWVWGVHRVARHPHAWHLHPRLHTWHATVLKLVCAGGLALGAGGGVVAIGAGGWGAGFLPPLDGGAPWPRRVAVPEPATLPLLAMGVVAAVAAQRRGYRAVRGLSGVCERGGA